MKTTAHLIAIWALLLLGCGNGYESATSPKMDEMESMDRMALSEAPSAVMSTAQLSSRSAVKQKLIKTADLYLETKDYKASKAEVEALVKQMQGYMSRDEENNSSSRTSASMVIRVPAVHFDSLVHAVCALAYHIDSRNVRSTDVTEEFVDIEARLKTKRAVEARYMELLKQARTIKEILEVEEHLRVLREEIESREGRLKYLSSQVGFSTINLTLYEQHSSPSYRRSFGDKVADALGSGWEGLITFLLGLLHIWPFLIIFALLVWALRRYLHARRQRKS